MINNERIVPITTVDYLSMIATVMKLNGTTFTVAEADGIGTFTVTATGDAGKQAGERGPLFPVTLPRAPRRLSFTLYPISTTRALRSTAFWYRPQARPLKRTAWHCIPLHSAAAPWPSRRSPLIWNHINPPRRSTCRLFCLQPTYSKQIRRAEKDVSACPRASCSMAVSRPSAAPKRDVTAFSAWRTRRWSTAGIVPISKADCHIVVRSTGVEYEIMGEPENINMQNQYMRFKVIGVKGGA